MRLGRQVKSIKGSAAVLALALPMLFSIVVLGLWANDVRQDREHTVIVDEPTPLLSGSGKGCNTSGQIAVVQRGAVLSVRRIRYWKDCTTLDVTAQDDRGGHFVLGVGRVEVKPPLP
jgi:hypothetical protein